METTIDKTSPQRHEQTPAYEALSASSLGLEMALAIFVGWGVGFWLDGQLGTAPWLMVVFLGCGIGAACKPVIRVWRKAKAKSAAAPSKETPGTGA